MLERGPGGRTGTAAGGRGCGPDDVAGELTGELERLPGVGGWYVVRVDAERSRRLRPAASRGFVPVTVGVGGSTWDTSLMPLGDGTLFLALPAAVRRAEDLEEGDEVRAVLRHRERPVAPRRRRW